MTSFYGLYQRESKVLFFVFRVDTFVAGHLVVLLHSVVKEKEAFRKNVLMI